MSMRDILEALGDAKKVVGVRSLMVNAQRDKSPVVHTRDSVLGGSRTPAACPGIAGAQPGARRFASARRGRPGAPGSGKGVPEMSARFFGHTIGGISLAVVLLFAPRIAASPTSVVVLGLRSSEGDDEFARSFTGAFRHAA